MAGNLDFAMVLRLVDRVSAPARTASSALRRITDAALERSQRTGSTISIELGGFHGDLMAEARLDLQGIEPERTGQWLVTRVQHRLADTLTTSLQAERDNETAQGRSHPGPHDWRDRKYPPKPAPLAT